MVRYGRLQLFGGLAGMVGWGLLLYAYWHLLVTRFAQALAAASLGLVVLAGCAGLVTPNTEETTPVCTSPVPVGTTPAPHCHNPVSPR